MKNIKLLFVCLGNICRSPAAQGIMESLVKNKGLEKRIFIDSAGIGGWHAGQLPDKRMRDCGALHGYNFSHHARQFQANRDFDKFDYIFGMDSENCDDLRRMACNGKEKAKVRPFAQYLHHHPGQPDIPDPYYGGHDDFEFVIELLEDACTGLLEELQNEE